MKSTAVSSSEVAEVQNITSKPKLAWVGILAAVYLMLLSVSTIGSGFKHASAGHVQELFSFATNPFLGLLVGTVATALIQSSSTVTSIIVGLVAGGLPVESAIPMVMGANIGTTITNTIVSLGHIRHPGEFKRAFSAATIHDFFNLLSVVIFLPLEMSFGLLEHISAWVISFIPLEGSMSMKSLNFVKPITKPIVSTLKSSLSFLGRPFDGIVMISIGIAVIFIAISFMGRTLKKSLTQNAEGILHKSIGQGSIRGIFSGTIVTILVQSSSTTTSLIVPLAGNGILSTKEIYPFTLGANIGTCITALLAATAISGPAAPFALQIAVIHLLYNVLGVIIIYGNPLLRSIPLKGATSFAELASNNKLLAAAYILGVFFVTPGLLLTLYSS